MGSIIDHLSIMLSDVDVMAPQGLQKKGKDTWQSILGYLAKYPNILFWGCFLH